MLPAHQLGRVSDFSTEAQAPARDNHRGQGMGHLQVYTYVTGVPRPSAHNAAPTPESSLRGHRSQNRVGSDVASPATVRPWGRWPGSR